MAHLPVKTVNANDRPITFPEWQRHILYQLFQVSIKVRQYKMVEIATDNYKNLQPR